MKLILILVVFIGFAYSDRYEKPKLIWEITIDGGSQWMVDLLWERMYSIKAIAENGIMNLKNDAMAPNTAPSHTILSTGAIPAYSGIIGNSHRDENGNIISAFADTGTHYALNNGEIDKVLILARGSPDHATSTNIQAETLSDVIVRTGGKSRTVSGKNRGAIATGGHPRIDRFGNKHGAVAYWFNQNDQNCNMVTSEYFEEYVPQYVTDFNNNGFCQSLVIKEWNPLYPVETMKFYDMNREGSKIYAKCPEIIPGQAWPKRYASKPSSLTSGPGGDELVVEFGELVFDEEELGHGQRHEDPNNEIVDHFVTSFSGPDGCIHYGGLMSMECEDQLYRTDMGIGRMYAHILTKVSPKDLVIKISADHGGGNPIEMNIADGYTYSSNAGISSTWVGDVNAELAEYFDFVDTGVEVIKKVDPGSIWFDNPLFTYEEQDLLQIYVAEVLREMRGITFVYTNNYMEMHRSEPGISYFYHSQRSPDVYYMVVDKGYPYISAYLQARVVAGHSESSVQEACTVSIISRDGMKPKVNYVKTRQTQSVPSICAVARIPLPSGAFDEIYPGLDEYLYDMDPYGVKSFVA